LIHGMTKGIYVMITHTHTTHFSELLCALEQGKSVHEQKDDLYRHMICFMLYIDRGREGNTSPFFSN
jgi:hypothetical protein